jgi:hypothetical protein
MKAATPVAALCFLGMTALPAIAEEPDGPITTRHPYAVSEGGTFSITFENDLFGNSDRNYTNGARISYVTPRNDLPWIGRVARRNLGWLTDAEDWYTTFSLGQNIYTPEDLSLVPPDPDDRPYAGYLYASFGIVADRGDRLDTIALDVGVVGPASQADYVQRLVHDALGLDDPKGWSYQLENEPGLRLLYERKYRFGYNFNLPVIDLAVDAAPHYALALGNVDTSAAAGLTVRIGDKLRDNYGPPRVRPAVAGPGFYESDSGFGWYLFAGAEGRAVARNIFIEGNTWRDSPGVDPKRLVADLQAGVALQFGSYEIAYTHVFRSPEFDGDDGFNDFGSLTVSAKF